MRYRWLYISFAVLAFSTCHAMAPEQADMYAVSLKNLQRQVAECVGAGDCPDEYVQLGGLTRVNGFVVDEDNRDVILFGEAQPGDPPLLTEDFVVALRSSWIMYYTLSGNTRRYYNPGCSIDPRSTLASELHRVMNASRGDVGDVGSLEELRQIMRRQNERLAEDWQEVCAAPQDVRVLGIPFHTHFADILVRADYYMKRLSNGTVQLDIDGFYSHMDLWIDAVRNNPNDNRASASTTRFWFYPGKNVFTDGGGIVRIDECPVTLLTELEYSSDNADSDPFATEFARLFTAHFAEIAERRPIYARLEGLFRLVALTKIFKYMDLDRTINLDYFLNGFPIPATTIEKTLPGIAHSHIIDSIIHTSGGGGMVTSLPMFTCGGVDIGIKITPDQFHRPENAELEQFRNWIINSQPTSTLQVRWRIRRGSRRVQVTRTRIDLESLDHITSLIEELPGSHVERIQHFIGPTGELEMTLDLVNESQDKLIEAEIYDILSSFKLTTPSVTFAVVPEENTTIGVFSRNLDPTSIVKFRIYSNKIRYFWQKFVEFASRRLSTNEKIEFINAHQGNFGKVMLDKVGNQEAIALLYRGKLCLNMQEIFPEQDVVAVANHDMIRAEENFKWLKSSDARINPAKTVVFSGIPTNSREFAALEVFNATKEREWITRGNEFANNMAQLRHRPEYRDGMYNVKAASRTNIENALADENIETLVLLAHSDGKSIYFTDGSNQVRFTVEDIQRLAQAGRIKCKSIVLICCQTGGRAFLPGAVGNTFAEALIAAGVRTVIAPSTNIDAESGIDFLNGLLIDFMTEPTTKSLLEILKKQNLRIIEELREWIIIGPWVKTPTPKECTHG